MDHTRWTRFSNVVGPLTLIWTGNKVLLTEDEQDTL